MHCSAHPQTTTSGSRSPMAPARPGEAVSSADDILARPARTGAATTVCAGALPPRRWPNRPVHVLADWQDGAAEAIRNSAQLSPHLMQAAELIVLLAQAQDAAPPTCPHCGAAFFAEDAR